MDEYDRIIREHYQREAHLHCLSPESTMADSYIRDWESASIVAFVRWRISVGALSPGDTIADVGCGNGYTIARLAVEFPQFQFRGYDQLDEFVGMAQDRLAGFTNATVQQGDLRQGYELSDVALAVSQRVLINILDPNDQKVAIANLVRLLRQGQQPGSAILIESFSEALLNLNTARAEHALPPLRPQHHNLYLDSDCFDAAGLRRLRPPHPVLQRNYLSSHYFFGRVLYPLLTPDSPVARNSHLVDMLRQGLGAPMGDYSPLQVLCFERRQSQ
jgi:SAM-dependent methyltransferase